MKIKNNWSAWNYFLVTESQGQAVVTAPISAKQNSGSTPSSQPYTRLSGYHPDVRAKQLDVSTLFIDLFHIDEHENLVLQMNNKK